jgi:hypothetical protein
MMLVIGRFYVLLMLLNWILLFSITSATTLNMKKKLIKRRERNQLGGVDG